MFAQPHAVTPSAVVEFTRHMLSMLAGKYGGGATLNELRVMNQIVLCGTKGRACRVTSLHQATGIPISTVSRVVTKLQTDGWLSDRRDPTDGRKRIIFLGPRSLTLTPRDIDEAIRWINDFREHGLPN